MKGLLIQMQLKCLPCLTGKKDEGHKKDEGQVYNIRLKLPGVDGKWEVSSKAPYLLRKMVRYLLLPYC
jgi:hypothetical protein